MSQRRHTVQNSEGGCSPAVPVIKKVTEHGHEEADCGH